MRIAKFQGAFLTTFLQIRKGNAVLITPFNRKFSVAPMLDSHA